MEQQTQKSKLDALNEQFQKNKLEALNEQFRKQQEQKAQKPEAEEKKSILKKYKYAFLIPILVLICIAGFIIWRKVTGDIRTVPMGLPQAEVEKWKNKEVDKERVFISLNTSPTIQEDKTANLSLMNPPYSAYNFRIMIALEDESETILYTSDLVKPGTFNKTVEFQEIPAPGSYEAVVHYTFYGNTEDDVIGEHDVPITIDVNG